MLRVGTRGSALALWQAERVREALGPTVATELVVVETRGDRDRSTALTSLGTQGFFTKELEEALLDGRVDVAVHSLKDLPTRGPEGLEVVAVLERGDARDALLVRPDAADPALGALPLRHGGRIGTGSNRRRAQIRRERPDLEIGDLRGNVPTRIRKLRDGEHDAILVAEAALRRLEPDLGGLEHRVLDVRTLVPAPGQAAVAVQMRRDDPSRSQVVAAVDHPETAQAVTAERRLMALLEGGCQLPLGVHVAPARASGFALLASVAPPPAEPGALPDAASPLFAIEGDDLDGLVAEAHRRLSPLARRGGREAVR